VDQGQLSRYLRSSMEAKSPPRARKTERTSRNDTLLLLAFGLSGLAGLGYEILWTRLLGIGIGSEMLAVFGVLAGFFGGMALGAALLQPLTRRVKHPLFLFAVLEIIAAVYALASPSLLHGLALKFPLWLGPKASSLQTVLAAGAALLPATICLGATLAAIVEARRRRFADSGGYGLGRLYGANTFGALLGVMLTVYLFLPGLGFQAASMLLAGFGFAAAACAVIWGKNNPSTDETPEPSTQPKEIDSAHEQPARMRTGQARDCVPHPWLLAMTFFTGLVAVGFEVVAVRILSQSLENTVFTFANILAVYLGGTAFGAAAYAATVRRRQAGKIDSPNRVMGLLLFLLAASVIVGAWFLQAAPAIHEALAGKDASYGAQLVAELGVAAAVFFIPTALMGALFSHLIGAVTERHTGYAYALNTLGSALAPFVFGLVALPKLGFTNALYAVAYGYLAVFVGYAVLTLRSNNALHTGRSGDLSLRVIAVAVIALVAAEALAPKALSLAAPPKGWHVKWRREGLFGTVLVAEKTGVSPAKATLSRRLQLGGRFRMGGQRAFGERRMGHIPLLLSAKHDRLLFLGVGTGATLSATRSYPANHVDAVELIPEVLAALPHFSAINDSIHRARNVHFHVADARRFVAAKRDRYDVIVADLFHPARDGAGSLYSLEQFKAARRALVEGGLFVQWIPLYQVDPKNLATIIKTFVTAFDDAHAFLGLYSAHNPILALVGHQSGPNKPLRINLQRIESSLRTTGAKRYVKDAKDLFAGYLMDRRALVRFSKEAPLNTALEPRLLFDAPRAAYEGRKRLSYRSLATLLPLKQAMPAQLIEAPAARKARFLSKLSPYAASVRDYLEADISRVRSADKRYSEHAVQLLLRAFERSPDFSPAKGLLLMIARHDARMAGQIFSRMLRQTPGDLRLKVAYVEHLRRAGNAKKAKSLQAEVVELLQRGRTQARPSKKPWRNSMAPRALQ
jgi:spermidine synthase